VHINTLIVHRPLLFAFAVISTITMGARPDAGLQNTPNSKDSCQLKSAKTA
jgi:hypothetical protein